MKNKNNEKKSRNSNINHNKDNTPIEHQPEPPPPQQLNPNWALLQQKLIAKGASAKPRDKSVTQNDNSVLGKRKERSVEELDEREVIDRNPLTPTSSDFSVTDTIAMDCEMVGVSPLGNKSALGRATLVNKWGNVIYDEFVRPVDFVVDFRTQISGIRPSDLKKAKDFRVVQNKVAELLKGRILVGHALRNDLKALLLSHPKTDIRDTAEYQPFLKEGRSRALKHLASEFLDVVIQNGEHCPIEDGRAAMLLYQKNKKQWERSMKDRIRFTQKMKKRKHKKGRLSSVNNNAAS
ncbi:RNA exonuclease 4 [Heracleum sosnowskyi]|uniref:RNA exonuclease 4 n=1 Tax=Heracleum sosnowskyi TaxID=360622 RepID=A0AAD8N4B5_9APIA|nr:RNA exonuclease 4 [Heracleum sosnowskyi]